VPERVSGILLHPSSLPGPFGIGELGEEAVAFLDFLQDTGQRLWQVLPLGPTGYGDSPYQCFSAFAGNPLLVSLDGLQRAGLVAPEDLARGPRFPERAVDFGPVIEFKRSLLAKAFAVFERTAGAAQREAFEAFCRQHEDWLPEFALFMALKRANGGRAWSRWDRALVTRRPEALDHARRTLTRELREVEFEQWLFFEQWAALRARAHERGISIMGDLPIFVAQDSAEVWAHPEIFHLAADGTSSFQAGVPPDYFSATGQLWGNPLYRWDALARTGYEWWIARFRALLALVDRVRLDHFRGF
jgi:4-alpha-glucanotransferase